MTNLGNARYFFPFEHIGFLLDFPHVLFFGWRITHILGIFLDGVLISFYRKHFGGFEMHAARGESGAAFLLSPLSC